MFAGNAKKQTNRDMKNIFYLSALIILLSCSQTRKKDNVSEGSGSTTEKTDSQSIRDPDLTDKTVSNSITYEEKLTIDSLLLARDNEYLLSYKTGELILCCYDILESDILNLNIFKKTVEEYNEEDGIKKVDVYEYGNSYIKQFYNSHPQVDRLDLVCGDLFSDKIELSNGIRIGMTKADLLGKLFQKSAFFDSVRIMTVYENEIGDYWTSYIFKNNKLAEIKFDSSYDWIDKGLKK